jgi:hypothetical protein
MTRNLITPEIAERARTTGSYTFNAFPPDGYVGPIMVFAAIRLGDHAHIEIQSGRWSDHKDIRSPSGTGSPHVGLAGRVVMAWWQWEAWRDLMDATTPYRIAEVEAPTDAMLKRYVTVAPPDEGQQIF